MRFPLKCFQVRRTHLTIRKARQTKRSGFLPGSIEPGTGLKALLILLSLAADHGAVADRIGSLGPSLQLLLYGLLFALLAAGLLLAAAVRSHPLRLLYALLLSAAALFMQASKGILGDDLSYDAFVNLLSSEGFIDDALAQYGRSILLALPGALLLFAGVALPPRRKVPVPGFVPAIAPLAGVAILAATLFWRGGEGARGLPGAFTPWAYSLLSLYEAETLPDGPRQRVTIPRHAALAGRDIVLVVDESVLGTFLDVGGPSGVRSGLAEPRPGVAIRNYGRAASITNCSVGTNLTLRHGGTREDYARINATMPSIWDYARAAGLRTVYIDAQRTGGALHNRMTARERASIDRFVQFDGVPVRDRDMAAADMLARLLGDGTAQFILVNKVGAHFPVHDKYPDAFLRYRPVLPRGYHRDVSDTGSRAGFGGSAEEWLRYRNSYRNSLLWNVGAFFDRLFVRGDLSRATLLYTSDHGQDLHERGRRGVNTHCSIDPVSQEGQVPLVVIEGAGLRTLDWDRNLAANRDRASHYRIFPTLLALMGYDVGRVRSVYGDSLVPPSRDPMTFNARFNARLGRKPVWRSVEGS